MAVARKLLTEKVVTVGSTVVRLDTLLTGTAWENGIVRATIHNLSKSVDLYIVYAAAEPATAAMDIITPDGSKEYEHEKGTLHDVWVYAASNILVCVKQDGV